MIELRIDRLRNAIAKARRVRNHVRLIAGRRYEVKTPKNHIYFVTFTTRDGKHFASCTCAAGANDQECYHIPGAALLDSAIAWLQEQEKAQTLQTGQCKPQTEAPRATRRDILIRRDCRHTECKTSRCEQGRYIGGIAV